MGTATECWLVKFFFFLRSSLLLQLFDHVSESLKDFLHEKNISLERKHPLAFTFSFPCEQSTLNQVMTQNPSSLQQTAPEVYLLSYYFISFSLGIIVKLD